ncbi:MAG: hypothetical protein M0Z33_04355, partial [Actinomycetota bacterium]|nr:hypothetical protein [Actinomycetota bacterium]
AAALGARAVVVEATAGDAGPLLAAATTPYVAPVPSGSDEVASGRLARCVAGLESNPVATVAVSGRAGLGGPVPTLLDGRSIASSDLAAGRPPLGGALFVVRASSVGEERLRDGHSCGGSTDWADVLALRVLLRGSLWCDAADASSAGGGEDDRGGGGRRASQAVLDEAAASGLVDRPDACAGRLGLAVVVIADDPTTFAGGRLRTLATARRAAAVVERVVVLEVAPDGPPASIDGVEWLSAGEPCTAERLRELLGADVPALVLRAGEELDVADRAQVRAALADGARPVRLRTGAGGARRVESAGALALGPVDCHEPGPVTHGARIVPLGGHGDWLRVPTASRAPASGPRARFAVLAPDYTGGSGGSVALHRLCDLLNATGCEAVVVPMEAAGIVNDAWRTPRASFRGSLPDDVVAIYPEVVVGNPLGARRVVRWLLNRPGRLNGGRAMEEGPEDLLVAYDPQIDPALPVLWVPIVDPTVFFPKDRPGRGRLLWVGKGTVPPDLDRSGTLAVSRAWPATKRDLAAALRAADALVSCDWLTALIAEALMCATPVLLVDGQEWSSDELERFDPAARRGVARTSEGGDALERARRGAEEFHEEFTRRYAHAAGSVDAFVDVVVGHFSAR